MKTQLDHWLLRTFVFRYCVCCNTVPTPLPDAIEVSETTQDRWTFRLFCEHESDFQLVTARLAASCFAFQSKVEIRDTIVAKLLSHYSRDSIVLRFVWILIKLSIFGVGAIVFAKWQAVGSLFNKIRQSFGILQHAT